MIRCGIGTEIIIIFDLSSLKNHTHYLKHLKLFVITAQIGCECQKGGLIVTVAFKGDA